jgi:ribosomal protein L30
MAKLRITYTKSAIGYSKDQKDTIRSLGLRKLQSVALHDDNPAIRGMAFKVRHLVKVEEVAEELGAKPAKPAKAKIVKQAPEPVSHPAAKAPKATLAPAVLSEGDKADNLELIEGIGPKIAAVLTEAGIATFADLAAADVSRLSEILQQEGNLRLADPSTWPEQAALAAAGKWDEFQALTEQLKGGRRA